MYYDRISDIYIHNQDTEQLRMFYGADIGIYKYIYVDNSYYIQNPV